MYKCIGPLFRFLLIRYWTLFKHFKCKLPGTYFKIIVCLCGCANGPKRRTKAECCLIHQRFLGCLDVWDFINARPENTFFKQPGTKYLNCPATPYSGVAGLYPGTHHLKTIYRKFNQDEEGRSEGIGTGAVKGRPGQILGGLRP